MNIYKAADRNFPHIIVFARGDVTGDGILNNVYLTGMKTQDSNYIQNITLLIQDGRTGQMTSVPLSENAGYNPVLFLGDFTGNGVSDILISINSGGSGGMMYHYVYSFLNNAAQLLFDFQKYNEEFKYEVKYKDEYKVEVRSLSNNKKYILDISARDESYLKEIYYENGKLISPITGFVNPLSGLYPVDFDLDNKYELLAYQRIAGRYNADSLGYVLNTLGWMGDRFVLQNNM